MFETISCAIPNNLCSTLQKQQRSVWLGEPNKQFRNLKISEEEEVHQNKQVTKDHANHLLVSQFEKRERVWFLTIRSVNMSLVVSISEGHFNILNGIL